MVENFLLVLLISALVDGDTIKKAKERKKIYDVSKEKSQNFNLPIIDVVKKHGKTKDDVYDENLFELSKQFTGVDQSRIMDGFKFSPDLVDYIKTHSYLEVLWCFKLYKEMTFYKTFEKILSLEPMNKFTIFSATGSKPWPSGKNPRHVVCDAISKQPVTSGLYEKYLVPARCKALHVTTEAYHSVLKFFNIKQLATRLEFALALDIQVVVDRIKPKIKTALVKKLNAISFELIIERENRANGNHGNTPQLHSSILKLISDSYRIPHHALEALLNYYSEAPRKVAVLNEASFRSVCHFTKVAKSYNVFFGEIYAKMDAAMTDLYRMLKMPLILALDKNHIQHSIVNKTLLSIMIIIAREPGGVIMSYYGMPDEVRWFIEKTRMSKFHIIMSQSKIRLEHLSIDFFVNLLRKQTVASIKDGNLRHEPEEINAAYISSVKKIITKSTLVDFQRIYQKSWPLEKLKDVSLLDLAIIQGLTGNEFLQVYGMDGKNITEVTLFTKYTFGMLQTYEEKDIFGYTLKQLGELVKKEINQIVKTHPVEFSTTESSNRNATSIRMLPNNAPPEVDAASINRRAGPPPAMVITPVALCFVGTVLGLIAWIYHARKKARQSAW